MRLFNLIELGGLYMSETIFGSLFEEDFLLRTLGPIANSSDIALTELVANAWDAGASKVDILVPKEYSGDNEVSLRDFR